MKSKMVLLAIILFMTGCAKDYYTSLNQNSSGEVGSLQIKISTPMQNVNLTIDNKLVAKDKFTDQIIVNNISAGKHELLITAHGNGRHDLKKNQEIMINPGQQNTQLVQAPGRTTGSYILQYGSIVAAVIIASILTAPN